MHNTYGFILQNRKYPVNSSQNKFGTRVATECNVLRNLARRSSSLDILLVLFCAKHIKDLILTRQEIARKYVTLS
jgi:hypothetical protein